MSSSPLLELPTEILQQIVDECDPGSHFPLVVSCRRCFAVAQKLLDRHRECSSTYGPESGPWTMTKIRQEIAGDPIAVWHIRTVIWSPERGNHNLPSRLWSSGLYNLRQITIGALHDPTQSIYRIDIRSILGLIALPALKKLSIALTIHFDPQENDICTSYDPRLAPSSSLEDLQLAKIDFVSANRAGLDPSGFVTAALIMAPALLTLDVICSRTIADRILQCLPGTGSQRWYSSAGVIGDSYSEYTCRRRTSRWFWTRDWHCTIGQKATTGISKPASEGANSWGGRLAWLNKLQLR